MTDRRRNAGFTLVEVMVALAVFALIAAAGVTILSFSVRAQGASAQALDDLGAVEQTAAILTADLGQAIDRPTRDAGGALLPTFAGSTGGAPLLRLTRGGWSNVDASPRASLQKVEYRLEGGALLRVGYPALDGAAAGTPAVLIDRVAAAQLRFRFRGAWSDAWDAGAAPLPDAAELTLAVGVSRAQRRYHILFLVGGGDSGTTAAPTPTPGPAPGSGAPPPPARAPNVP